MRCFLNSIFLQPLYDWRNRNFSIIFQLPTEKQNYLDLVQHSHRMSFSLTKIINNIKNFTYSAPIAKMRCFRMDRLSICSPKIRGRQCGLHIPILLIIFLTSVWLFWFVFESDILVTTVQEISHRRALQQSSAPYREACS